ncbi:hypothetical protein SAMN06273572_101936 [Monaibacterium marinum]|uniref:Sulfotransferase family protein n=1 Tax=Pontivivens marinum TaxID=1690039 RepID=A0A2C9CPB5_9RHOB|nr:hypothetical protein [Monaibacterium marinum]SOH93082.1 hypothetical protein SAMN06273572_101936 [Monaibacterium marinum]
MAQSPYRYFAILGVMRTGSNLLQRTLDQIPSLNCYGELFNPAFINDPSNQTDFGMTCAERDADPMSLIDKMVASGKPRTLSGFRLFEGHNAQVTSAVLHDPTAAKIMLRRNPLDSYVSLKIAKETDQWMLMKQRARRSVQIHFDIAEYRDYVAQSDSFYARALHMMKVAGQTPFIIDFSELNDVAIINGIASWLGTPDRLDSIETTIQRQNPGPMEEKVENYAEMVDLLRNEGGMHRTGEGARSDRAGGLRYMYTTQNAPLLYASIPGGPNEQVLRWLHGVDGGDAQRRDFPQLMENAPPFGSIQNRKALTDWQQTHPGHVCFTSVRHPVARAYDVFMNRVFGGAGQETFPRIRNYAHEQFSMYLPVEGRTDRAELERAGYDVTRHRASFSAFLDFLRANLAGRTPMRKDALWTAQAEFVEGFSSAVTLHLILREEDLIAGAAYMRKRFNLGDLRNGVLRDSGQDHIFALREIWTPQIEAQCRAIYGRDYHQFGFKDWSAS